MAGSRALVLSVLAHGAVLAAIACRLPDHDPRARTPPPHGATAAIPIELRPRPAIEVALLDGAARDAAIDRTARRRGRADASAVRGGAQPELGQRESGLANPLAMRGLRHDLTLSGDALEQLAVDRPIPDPIKSTGRTRSVGRAGRIDDAVATFVVHADGSVDTRDTKDIDPHWTIPLPTPGRVRRVARELGDDLAAWRDNPYRDRDVGTTQDLPQHLQATPDACQRSGDPMCDATTAPRITRSLSGDGVIVPIVGGGLDLTSYLHRKFLGGPYTSRKLQILDHTRAERVLRGAVHRAAQLDRSAELMSRNLDALWRATTEPAARRQALFELWDECDEGDGTAGAAGARARAMVVGWIGARLPQGQPGAFAADDLARLDAQRSSTQHFAPY